MAAKGDGAGSVILLSGEPGIGKTRLVRELLAHVEVTGGQVARGECFAEGGAPFAPFADVLRRALTEQPPITIPDPILAELLTFAPDLALRRPWLSRTSDLDPAGQQQRTFEAFALFLEALSARAPLAVFIDDIHWADAGSLQLLHTLARRVRRMPVLLVLTYREIEIDENPPFSRLLQELTRERLAERLKLTRLTREQTRQLLQAMFAEEITPEFLDGVYTESEGNPFFIEEICKAILDSGKVAFEDGRWRRPGVKDLEIPQSIRGAILSRVAKLSEAAREAMLMAAILGREFEFKTLRRATDMPEESLIGALEAAEHAQLIAEARRNGDVVFSFAHALIPASLAESVSVLRRRLLHRRAAAAIETAHPEAWEVLAYHWIEAGEDELARVCSLRAADRAYASLARGEAVPKRAPRVGKLHPASSGWAPSWPMTRRWICPLSSSSNIRRGRNRLRPPMVTSACASASTRPKRRRLSAKSSSPKPKRVIGTCATSCRPTMIPACSSPPKPCGVSAVVP